jgi:hypothetical protein
METLTLTDQQGVRIAELPEGYRVIGVDQSAPFVRKPTGQVMRIQQNGNLTAATTAAKDRLAAKEGDQASHVAGGVHASTPYTELGA